MTIELKLEDQRVIEQAIHLGGYNDSSEVISAALEMFAEDLEDVAVSKAREQEPRSTLAEVEAELRNLGKL